VFAYRDRFLRGERAADEIGDQILVEATLIHFLSHSIRASQVPFSRTYIALPGST
jgi:hypothetical protein